jgi:hypothetical protein
VQGIAVPGGRWVKWDLWIIDEEGSYAVDEVFEDARMYWYRFISGLGLIV